MQFWNEIINTALLGTEKKPVAVAALPMPLQEAAAIVTEQSATDKEEQFLQLAAVSFNFRQSGIKPLHEATLSVPEAEAESRRYCSIRAAQVLKDILAEDTPPLLAFWLDHCVAAQQLVSPDLVPTLLSRAVNHKAMQPAVTAICGRRGEWLSRFNSAWEFSAVVDDDQLWQTGQPEQRRALLRRMRRQDAAKAREWLIQSWPQENANTRLELVKQLDGTMQMEDEPFLLDQLNERSQKIKDEAIRLLKQLPGSILVTKYQELVQPMIFLKKEKTLLGMMTKTSLQIQPPVVPEKGEYIPGIDKLSNDKFFTDGEFVLYQLMQNIPPAFWEQHFALPPAEILGLFSGSNEKYVPAFVKATVQFGDQKWAQVYLEHRDVFYADLLDLLPPSQQDAYCLRNFSQYADLIIQQAREWPREWSFVLSKEIIGHTAKQPYQYNISFYKTNIARIPAAVAGLLGNVGPAQPAQLPLWINISQQISRLLGLKEQTHKAFNE
jgi:hypothetical protein